MKEYIIGVPERTGVEDQAMVPAINQRELVRCKDCKLYHMTGCPLGVYVGLPNDDDFCSYGKRKEY